MKNNKYKVVPEIIYKYNNFFIKMFSFELYKKIIYKENNHQP